MTGGCDGTGMSGGGTGLMSGGGLSMGSIGRGTSGIGFGGCSMLMPDALQLHVQADGAHERQRIAVLDDARTHAVVEDHLPVLQAILEVHVDG